MGKSDVRLFALTGAVAVPLNCRLSAGELAVIMNDAGAKRTKAEVLVNNCGATQMKIAALVLQEFSTEDRDMIMAILISLKNTLEEALAGATNPSKNLA